MTTIAVKDGIVVSDTAITNYKKRYIGTVEKIFRLPNGQLYASCGESDCRELRKLLRDVKTPDDMPLAADLAEIKADIEAIVLFKTGEIWNIATGKSASAEPVQASHFAIGSGRDFAVAALDAMDSVPNDWSSEKKLKAAVTIACERDIFSRLPLKVEKA